MAIGIKLETAHRLLWLLLVGASPIAAANAGNTGVNGAPDCDCLCVNGVATTLCSTILAAQAGRQLCLVTQTCPQPAGGRALPPERSLQPPAASARRCRVAQLWDRQLEAYRQSNICDVEPLPE